MTSSGTGYEDQSTPEELSRRTFLAGATVVLGGIVGIGVAVPVVASLIPTEEIIAGSKSWSPLDPDEMRQLQASTDKPIKIFFTQDVKDGYLEAQNKDYVWGVKLRPDDLPKLKTSRPDLPDLKVVAEGFPPYAAVTMGFVMFSSICPHLGCRFNWDDAQSKFACPCHGSQFTVLGEHIAGPAPRGLDPLPLQEREGVAQITWIRYKQGEPTRIVVSFS